MNRIGALACMVVCLGLAQPVFARGEGRTGGPSAGARSGAHPGGSHSGGSHFSGPVSAGHYTGTRSYAPPARIAVPPRPHFVPRPYFSPAARVIVTAPFVAAPLYYYPPPPAYYPPPGAYAPGVLVPPSQYIEQQPSVEAATHQYWYYCAEADAYYPYVKECPGGWEMVPPQPQP